MKYLFSFIIGSILGSFLLCMCTSKNIFSRSKCDHCDHVLKIYDLIPVLSYLILKGRCRYCKDKLDMTYLLSELIMSLLSVLLVSKYDLSINYLVSLSLVSILFCISIIDIKTYTIPLILNILIVVIRIFLYDISFHDILIASISSGYVLLISIILSYINKTEMMGLGDIKLLFSLGLYYNLITNIICILIASFSALIYSLFKKDKKIIAFGPFICISYLIMIVFRLN